MPATSNIEATSPGQAAVIEAQRTEDLRESRENEAQRQAREKSVHLRLVETLIEQDNSFAALAHLDSYDQRWGADRTSRLLRADSLRKTNQLDQAESLYKLLLGGQDQSRAGNIWYGLGKIAIERGDLTGAATRLEKSSQIDPLNITTHADLGLVYLLDGRKDESYNTLMKAQQLSNGDANILANLALWGLVYDDFSMAMNIADRLQWTETTRGQVMSQANNIKRRLGGTGRTQ